MTLVYNVTYVFDALLITGDKASKYRVAKITNSSVSVISVIPSN